MLIREVVCGEERKLFRDSRGQRSREPEVLAGSRHPRTASITSQSAVSKIDLLGPRDREANTGSSVADSSMRGTPWLRLVSTPTNAKKGAPLSCVMKSD